LSGDNIELASPWIEDHSNPEVPDRISLGQVVLGGKPVRPAIHGRARRRVTDAVRGKPARPEQPLVAVDDLDARRKLAGIDAMIT
jgi:hypothetical protein